MLPLFVLINRILLSFLDLQDVKDCILLYTEGSRVQY